MMCGIYFRNDSPLPLLINMKAACKRWGNMQRTAAVKEKKKEKGEEKKGSSISVLTSDKSLDFVFTAWTPFEMICFPKYLKFFFLIQHNYFSLFHV